MAGKNRRGLEPSCRHGSPAFQGISGGALPWALMQAGSGCLLWPCVLWSDSETVLFPSLEPRGQGVWEGTRSLETQSCGAQRVLLSFQLGNGSVGRERVSFFKEKKATCMMCRALLGRPSSPLWVCDIRVLRALTCTWEEVIGEERSDSAALLPLCFCGQVV